MTNKNQTLRVFFVHTSIGLALAFLFIASVMLPLSAKAADGFFNTSLGYGSHLKSEVLRLQNFLAVQGYFNVKATGNYLSVTKAAVQAFQRDNSIQSTGFFGPLSRAAANGIIARGETATKPMAQIQLKEINPLSQTASLSSLNRSAIRWESTGYPNLVPVTLNVLSRTSDSPISYQLLRQINNVPNTGYYVLTREDKENGNNIYIEITCSASYLFTQDCTQSQPLKLN